ncbi:MAG: arginine decarboxylase, pyruvoyl-dependent [Candidatus Omnitrophica bacterium]|nr:arginine decarboxylase, pyruvoyl-dependent [Candidatus Omnitrophota bacterium]MDD5671669.1 arginine decarboxylase, pyruvoyl-dependent [Candidatus Omnitrophota bacterium]
MILPKKMFLTKGVGIHKEKLSSFELALRDAGIAPFNIVRVSSIYPPYCKLISKEAGLKYLTPGQVVFTVVAECATNEPNRLIAASVGVAIPKNPEQYGYLSEVHTYGWTEKRTDDYAEDLAASMLATILGVKFDPDSSYDKRKEIWKISNQIFKTMAVTQSARGEKNGNWTTVISAAVLIH